MSTTKDSRSKPDDSRLGDIHDVEGAAKVLKVSPDTVRRLISRGQLRTFRAGRLLRIINLGQFVANGGSPQD